MHGPRWARTGADLAALAGVLSFVAAFWWGPVEVALFALVLLGLTVPRVAQLPGALQAASGPTIVFAAWASTLEWYIAVPHLDILVHALANGLLAAALVLLVVRLGGLPPRIPRSGAVLVVTGAGALLGVVWEIGEWLGHVLMDDGIQVGYEDTLGDLAAGTLGSALAGALLRVDEGDPDE